MVSGELSKSQPQSLSFKHHKSKCSLKISIFTLIHTKRQRTSSPTNPRQTIPNNGLSRPFQYSTMEKRSKAGSSQGDRKQNA